LIKVSVLYPNTADCKFDMHYYLNQHMPMVQQKLGPGPPGPQMRIELRGSARPGRPTPSARADTVDTNF